MVSGDIPDCMKHFTRLTPSQRDPIKAGMEGGVWMVYFGFCYFLGIFGEFWEDFEN